LLIYYHSLFLSILALLHRVFPLLQSFTHEFVYDHVWFCLYVYLLDLSSMYERKHATFTIKTPGH
jgi:hypothetical protein